MRHLCSILGLNAVSTSSQKWTGRACGRGLDSAAGYAQKRIDHGFGQIAVVVRLGSEHGHVCGRVVNADRARTLTNCGRGCRLACGLLPGLCRTCSSRSTNAALEIRWTICRMLRGLPTGCQPGRCSSAKRTASRIPAAIAWMIHRTLRGRYADTNRLRSQFRTTCGLVVDWMRLRTSCRTSYQMLRDYCATCCLTFM